MRPTMCDHHADGASGVQLTRVARGRVLVVDDDRDCAALLVHALSAREFHVFAAHAPDEALAVARTLDPHVAILDLQLGARGDGHALGTRLRAESTRPVQLIAFTGDDRPAIPARSKALGFVAHLVKPVRLHEIVELVQVCAERARRPKSSPEMPVVVPSGRCSS